MAANRNPSRPGNHNRQEHGAGSAEVALTKGVEFSGLAVVTEKQVAQELETGGIAPIEKRNAIRLQVVSDLYYAAILGADNLEDLDRYVKRFGWLCASTLRAWAQVREGERNNNRVITEAEILEAINGSEENHDHD